MNKKRRRKAKTVIGGLPWHVHCQVPPSQISHRDKSPSLAATVALPEKDLSASRPFLAQLSGLKGIFLPLAFRRDVTPPPLPPSPVPVRSDSVPPPWRITVGPRLESHPPPPHPPTRLWNVVFPLHQKRPPLGASGPVRHIDSPFIPSILLYSAALFAASLQCPATLHAWRPISSKQAEELSEEPVERAARARWLLPAPFVVLLWHETSTTGTPL